MTEPTTAARHVQAKNRWHAAWVIIRESLRHPNTHTIIDIGDQPVDEPTEPPVPTCYVCGKVLDLPLTSYYPTREEYERQTMPAMAMVRAMEVMEVHRNHG